MSALRFDGKVAVVTGAGRGIGAAHAALLATQATPLSRTRPISGHGRMVMTTSTSALGSAELVSYGSAQAGVLGLGRAPAPAGQQAAVNFSSVTPSSA